MNTYFISDGSLIKIGRSFNPQKRLSGFQTSSAKSLVLLLTLPGDREMELHRRFSEDRVRGEWFEFSYDIRKFISEQTNQFLHIPFYVWLKGQRKRLDNIGRFAVIACSDTNFPQNSNQLIEFRKYYNNRHAEQQKKSTIGNNHIKFIMESAHTEWRGECTKNDGRHLEGICDKKTLATISKRTLLPVVAP